MVLYLKRILTIPKTWKESYLNGKSSDINSKSKEDTQKLNVGKKDLYELGILEADTIKDKDRYPILKGNGMVEEGLALVSMIARSLDLPMRKELCKKFLEQQEKRGKTLGIENIGGLCEELVALPKSG